MKTRGEVRQIVLEALTMMDFWVMPKQEAVLLEKMGQVLVLVEVRGELRGEPSMKQ